jgi:hypothetical protein
LFFRGRVKRVLTHQSGGLSNKQRCRERERKGAKHLCRCQNKKMKEEHVGLKVVKNFKCGEQVELKGKKFRL